MSESTQKKLGRVRPPRVQITYDVETGGAIEKKELPFLVGIMADLSGKRSADTPLPKLKARKFVEIDRDNFNDVMTGIAPRLAFQVPNMLQDDGSKLNVALTFTEIDSFEPVAVLKQVPALAKLYGARQKLNDLLAKLDGNDELDRMLNDVIGSTEKQAELRGLLAADNPAPAA
ncbi:type VI secretion system contractile sheath small subunit [Paracraurococcus ruber]|uniref:Type VI secretion system-associated protein n=1 Tax=Paracraurococcus ruber TaxID=77675 RepID=A0ABS1D285_9PROT|nr:type VI secretion system contractile sheath small subunit [Paracraurococcus ruber]MBK1660899.1 type VI secretion system-associated protein [Paracraurococcus ruber]TDG28734.1 type VI secretion system contractile sheath small subunit [Paracraurococcus ruber]